MLINRNVLFRLQHLVPKRQQFFQDFSFSKLMLPYVRLNGKASIFNFSMVNLVTKSHIIWTSQKYYLMFCANWPHFGHFLTRQYHWTCVHMLLKMNSISRFCIILKVALLAVSWNFSMFSKHAFFVFCELYYVLIQGSEFDPIRNHQPCHLAVSLIIKAIRLLTHLWIPL